MKRLLLLFAAASLLFAGCAKNDALEELEDRLDHMEGYMVFSAEEQIAAINSSIKALQAAKGLIDKKIEDLEGADAALEAGSNALGGTIESLKTHVGTLVSGNKTWAEATFATLDVMGDVLTRLGALETSVPALEQALTDLETGIKNWVGVQLEGYVTLSKFQNSLSTMETSVGNDVSGLRSDLEAAKTQLTNDYKAAIGNAINEHAGQVTDDIATAVSTATGNLQTAINAFGERIAALEAKMEAIIGRIQSVAVVPDYADLSVWMKPGVSNMVKFEISPAIAAKALVETENAVAFFRFQTVEALTKAADPAGEFTDFTVESVSMDENGEFVELTVTPASSYNSESHCLARLRIEANKGKGNYVCRTSSYFALHSKMIKTPQSLTFSDPAVDWILSDTRKIGGVYYPQDVSGEMTTVTLSSSNLSVAEISSDNNILVKGIGTTTITASAVESDEYLAGSASYVLSIYPRYSLKGVFSVSATKTVVFSKGNLQASVDAAGAPAAWRVAENQYDYLGEETLDLGLGTKELSLDLFCWSTDAVSSNWGIHTKTGTSSEPNIPGFTDGDFRDWGAVIGDGWRTLSKEEWTYLLNRQVNGGSGYMYAYRNFNFTAIKIDGEYVKGIFFYPDNYTGSYNETTWAEINAASIVFLPGGGYREGQMVMTDYNRSGLYWTSTPNHNDGAYFMTFAGDIETGILDANFRYMGYSVRLVSDFE